jgi:protein-tyrosine phosphatase
VRVVRDLHTHVLPGIDDGPPTVEGSIALARAAAGEGTTELCATPHITWDLPNGPATVRDGIARLQPALDAAGVPIRLRVGGEVAISRAVELSDEDLADLRLGGGEWLLVECPLSPAATGFDAALHHLQARGHRLVLAHPERSPALHRAPAKLRALVDAGMVSQITAGSLAGTFGKLVQRFTFDLVAAGLVHAIASDAHDAVQRPPGLGGAVEAGEEALPGFAEHVEWLTVAVPSAIVDGRPLPPAPGRAPQRRRRSLLRRGARSR